MRIKLNAVLVAALLAIFSVGLAAQQSVPAQRAVKDEARPACACCKHHDVKANLKDAAHERGGMPCCSQGDKAAPKCCGGDAKADCCKGEKAECCKKDASCCGGKDQKMCQAKEGKGCCGDGSQCTAKSAAPPATN